MLLTSRGENRKIFEPHRIILAPLLHASNMPCFARLTVPRQGHLQYQAAFSLPGVAIQVFEPALRQHRR